MLVASCLFKEDGTLLESQIPNIVVGDKESVKLEVSFYEDYDNLELLDLSNYIVEAIYERPDGNVSPALLLGIDVESNNKKYLIFGGWLTEVAGISKITVRLKKDGTVKATGFITFTIQDGNVPTDVVITEPQFESLENAIQAEEAARIADFQQAQADREAGDQQLDEKIDEVDERLQGNIDYEASARQAEDVLLGKRIDDHEAEVDELQAEADRVHRSKLDKNFSNVDISNLPVSPTDFVVIVSNGNSYKVTLEQLATLISQKTDYFKGYYATLQELQEAHPTAQAGDYAFVEEDSNNTDKFVMYVWDSTQEDGQWEETTSSQFVAQADYTALVQSLLDGTFNLGSIKVNDSPLDSPLLQSLHVNQQDYSLPSVELEFSDKPVEGGYNLGSINMGNNAWNIPNNMLKIKVSSEKIEGATSLGSITFGEDAYNVGGGNEVVELEVSTETGVAVVTTELTAEIYNKLKDIHTKIKIVGLDQEITLHHSNKYIGDGDIEVVEYSGMIVERESAMIIGFFINEELGNGIYINSVALTQVASL